MANETEQAMVQFNKSSAELAMVREIRDQADRTRLSNQVMADIDRFMANMQFYSRIMGRKAHWSVVSLIGMSIVFALSMITDHRVTLILSLSAASIAFLNMFVPLVLRRKLLPQWKLHQEIGDLLYKQDCDEIRDDYYRRLRSYSGADAWYTDEEQHEYIKTQMNLRVFERSDHDPFLYDAHREHVVANVREKYPDFQDRA